MISEIKKYIQERKIVSLHDLSVHFQVEASAMSKMVEKLIDKGVVVQKSVESCSVTCGECSISGCQAAQMIIFEYHT